MDGSWLNDTYVYYKGDDWDYIYDLAGADKLYLYDFDEEDVISASVDKSGSSIDITCNGERIVSIYRKNRDYSDHQPLTYKIRRGVVAPRLKTLDDHYRSIDF